MCHGTLDVGLIDQGPRFVERPNELPAGSEHQRGHAATQAAWVMIPVVVASGFAGLGYEIVWTRMLSLALGTEMMAVLGVVAGFFGGLAFGAFVLDRPVRAARSSRVAYAALEAVIGIWSMISIWLLPAGGRMLATLLGTDPSKSLLMAVSFVLPALALLPATAAMGGTLTALERMVAALKRSGRVTAGVYGANTSGAVAGTVGAVYLLIPAFGLSGTLLTLAAFNAACALGALRFGPPPEAAAKIVLPARPHGSVGAARLTITLFATGLLGVLFEVLVIRIAAQALQDTIFTFAVLLAAYLLGTAAGSLAWQRAWRPDSANATPSLIAVTALACVLTAAIAPAVAGWAATGAASGVIGEFAVAAALLLLPSAAMGALFGQLAQMTRDRRGSLGWAVGVNSAGAALAPAVAALALIPGFGLWTATLLVAAAYLLLLPPRRAAFLWGALPAAVVAALWLLPAPTLVRIPPGGRLLATIEGPAATASVVEDGGFVRYLEVNGHFRMGGTSSVRSDYRQAMLPLLLHPAPRSALFLGVGTGATLVGGSLMPGVAVRGIELLNEVTDLLPWFTDPAVPGPSPPVRVADARRYVAADRGQYDVIIADLFHPALDGSGALYTPEHFAAVHARLAPGGLFCQWLPLYQLDALSLRTIIRGFLDVYPDGSAWLAHFSVRTPMLALCGGRTPMIIDPARMAERLSEPALQVVAAPVGFENPLDVLGQFVASAGALRVFAGEGPRNTDDYPFVALDAVRNVRALTEPPAGLLLTVIDGVQPNSSMPLANPSLAPRLTAFWRARDRFIRVGAELQGDPRGLALIDAASPGLLETVRLSSDFNLAYVPLLSMAQALFQSDRGAGLRMLHAIADAAPARPEARALLARLEGP